MERRLRHKLRPYNAYFKAKGFDHPRASPREELPVHQFLIGLYGNCVTPSTQTTLYEYQVDTRGAQSDFSQQPCAERRWRASENFHHPAVGV